MASAVEEFEAFVRAMTAWERRHDAIILERMMAGDAAMAEMEAARAEVAEIFARHVVPERCDQSRAVVVSTVDPPKYDLDRDRYEVLSDTPSKTVIEYHPGAPTAGVMRFTLVPHDGRWLIDQSSLRTGEAGAWMRNPL